MGNIVKGSKKADVITVNAGSVLVATGKKQKNLSIVKSEKNKIYGLAGKDKITVRGGKKNFIYGGSGNDTIIVTKKTGAGNKFYGGAGKDRFSIKGGSSNYYYGGTAKDTFTIAGTIGTGNKVFGEAGNDVITINGGKKNYFYGDDVKKKKTGADTITIKGGSGNFIYGGKGKDVFVITQKGSATIKDYTAGQDTLKVTGGLISSMTVSGKNLIVKSGKSTVTLTNGAAKNISLKDSRGSYTASGTTITLGSNFTGTMDAGNYLNTVKTIDGRNATKAVNITGNDQVNIIYAGQAGGTINGGSGDDTLYSGAGNDTLTGGAGHDTFVYNGGGKDTVTFYEEGRDTLQISGGQISRTVLANSDQDLVFTVGSGNITLKNAAAKTISLKDSRGSYTASGKTITLGSDFAGTLDAGNFLSSVKIIDGRNAVKSVNITGNAQANTIYAGAAGGTYRGGAGDDRLYGGAGKDTFVYNSGNDTIYNYVQGSDIIRLASTTLKSSKVANGDVVLSLANGGSITVKNAAKTDIVLIDANGKEKNIIASGSGTASGGGISYGTDGEDSFVYAAGNGNVIIQDFTEGEDTLQIAGGTVTKAETVNGDVVLTVGDDGSTVTLAGAAGKNIDIRDGNGSYTLSDVKIGLGYDYMGDVDAGAYPATITTIDGSKAEGAINITGNARDNIIYAGKAGGALNGGAGNDTLYGGAGNDTFVYANGEGNDTVKGYEAGDALQVTGTAVDSVEIANGDMIFTVGSGSVTVEGASGKTVAVQDSRGSYSVSNTAITLGSDFSGTMDSSTFMPGARSIDGRAVESVVNITGNKQANTIYAGQAGGTLDGGAGDDKLYGGAGSDTLIGGAGNDTFVYANGEGNDTITDYEAGDILQVTGAAVDSVEIANGDMIFAVGSGSVTVEGASGKTVAVQDSRGSYSVSNTAITLGSDFTGTMDSSKFMPDAGTIDGRAVEGAINITGNNQANTIYAGQGGGILVGGAGDDTFVYANGGGNVTVTDYEEGQDTVEISGVTVSGMTLSGNDVVLSVGSGNGSVTVENGVENGFVKTISLKDDRGSYTVCDWLMELGSDFRGTINKDDYLDTIAYIYGQNAEGALNITGNAQMNVIYAGEASDTVYGGDDNDMLYGLRGDDTLHGDSGDDYLAGGDGEDVLYGGDGEDTLFGELENDTLYGGNGNDKLHGGLGDDTLTGGAGQDWFDYVNGGGNDTIKDYEEGQDTISITGGPVSGTTLSGTDVIFTVGDGSVKVENGQGKTISLKGDNGSYTVSGSAITLGANFTGDMDANVYLPYVTTIDSRASEKVVNITGNNLANTIYASLAGGTLHGGAGDDTFAFNSGSLSNSTIYDYETGHDIIRFEDEITFSSSSVSGDDVTLDLSTGGKINILGVVGQSITFDFGDGNLVNRTFPEA